MNAFAAAATSLFADRNMARDIEWWPAGRGVLTTVRGILRAPDLTESFGASQILSDTTVIEVLVAQVAEPRPGDVIRLDGEMFRVDGEPVRDALRLTWRLNLVPWTDA